MGLEGAGPGEQGGTSGIRSFWPLEKSFHAFIIWMLCFFVMFLVVDTHAPLSDGNWNNKNSVRHPGEGTFMENMIDRIVAKNEVRKGKWEMIGKRVGHRRDTTTFGKDTRFKHRNGIYATLWTKTILLLLRIYKNTL